MILPIYVGGTVYLAQPDALKVSIYWNLLIILITAVYTHNVFGDN